MKHVNIQSTWSPRSATDLTKYYLHTVVVIMDLRMRVCSAISIFRCYTSFAKDQDYQANNHAISTTY